MHEILYTGSQDMLVLSRTVASRYYNCCTDGSTSPGNYWISLQIPVSIHMFNRETKILPLKGETMLNMHKSGKVKLKYFMF
jgi:hypothetical protein